ncbi:MAG: T9SS type A sorting domain-containing protein, partial [candidate division WOR-3 bacterium]|nr:T9SS type A sorting domain-containing protein [candidate division WOR-3 bacterium]
WVVPDTPSNFANRFWLVVKGQGRYDSTSSPVFYIKRPTGIEEPTNPPDQIANNIYHPNLEIYPNPAYDKLTIHYVLPERSMVNLSLYDVSGRLIETMVNGVKGSGYHQKTLKISHLPQGVYFIRLNLDNNCIIRKIVIME